ncbi:hypothetical protein V8E36_001290 [Tilletia maclaganii]
MVSVTIVDPRMYLPEASPTAQRIGQPRLFFLPNTGMSQVSRWRDITTVGGIETYTTFDRAEQRMFTPAQQDAMGICAMSRYHTSSGGVYSLIEVLSRNLLLDRPVFALSLSRPEQTASITEHGGELSLGDHRTRLRYSPLEQDPHYAGLWAVSGTLNGIVSRMILASGSRFITLPVPLARLIFGRLGLMVEKYGSSENLRSVLDGSLLIF